PEGNIALGKLAQAVMHGARVIAIRGNFDEALKLVRQVADRSGFTLVNSINPHRIEGQQSAAWEIVGELARGPASPSLPVGNAGNIPASGKGSRAYRGAGLSSSLPRMMGFQAAGAAPIVDGKPVREPKTVATAIKIGDLASWKGAADARDE